jgi:hypothetical protein
MSRSYISSPPSASMACSGTAFLFKEIDSMDVECIGLSEYHVQLQTFFIFAVLTFLVLFAKSW